MSEQTEKPPLDQRSDAWIMHMRPWIRRRIEQLRDELEAPGADTDLLRGQIAELRHIVREVEPDLPEEGSSGTYFATGQPAT